MIAGAFTRSRQIVDGMGKGWRGICPCAVKACGVSTVWTAIMQVELLLEGMGLLASASVSIENWYRYRQDIDITPSKSDYWLDSLY
jgi:hypothetical protein